MAVNGGTIHVHTNHKTRHRQSPTSLRQFTNLLDTYQKKCLSLIQIQIQIEAALKCTALV